MLGGGSAERGACHRDRDGHAVRMHAMHGATSFAGIVTDAQGGVLPGVTVTATSPALNGSRIVVTEPNGSYRFPSVPEGAYVLTFELSGFQNYKRTNIVLSLGQTLTVDAQL